MTLEEKLTAAQARIAELETQLETERATVTTLREQLTQAETSQAEESALVTQLQGDLKQARQQHQDAQATVERLQSEAKTAEARAAEICASVGVEPQPVTAQGAPETGDLTEQLKAQKTPAEQTAFWRKYKDKILGH
jgi:chromosome segregation ATPase